MLKTKITNFNLEDKFIYLNPNISFIDLNLNRIATFIYYKEKQKQNTFLKSYSLKLQELQNLKFKLNTKKKIYFDILRQDYLKVISLSPFYSSQEFKTNKQKVYLIDQDTLKLIDKKIFKNQDLGIVHQQLFINRNFHTLNKLKNINQDIKKTELNIKNFQDYFFSISSQDLKINQTDLKILNDLLIYQNFKKQSLKAIKYPLKESVINATNHQIFKKIAYYQNLTMSQNLQRTFYFYFQYLHKKTKQKHFKTNHLKNALNYNIVTEKDILKIIENNFKSNIKKQIKLLNNVAINQTLQNNILNKYL